MMAHIFSASKKLLQMKQGKSLEIEYYRLLRTRTFLFLLYIYTYITKNRKSHCEIFFLLTVEYCYTTCRNSLSRIDGKRLGINRALAIKVR